MNPGVSQSCEAGIRPPMQEGLHQDIGRVADIEFDQLSGMQEHQLNPSANYDGFVKTSLTALEHALKSIFKTLKIQI